MDEFISKSLTTEEEIKNVHRIYYGGDPIVLDLNPEATKLAESLNVDFKSYRLPSLDEQLREPTIVRIGAIQNAIVLPTDAPLQQQRDALHKRIGDILELASKSGVNIVCLQECWTMPFAFCTREKAPWCEFAEEARDGPTTQFLSKLARKYGMVIISPILERDSEFGDTVWDTAVIIDHEGKYLGKTRKNHIPRVGDFNESNYYMESELGHPVFDTKYGKVGVNICYGKHHPLNWLMYALNGAQMIFNPCAITDDVSETFWAIEARNAAIANGVFTCGVNRVGTETFATEFTAGDGTAPHKSFGAFFGSSYVTAPNGTRTPGLSRLKDGLLVAEVDLNLCRQTRDVWGIQMTQRLPMYAKSLTNFVESRHKSAVKPQ